MSNIHEVQIEGEMPFDIAQVAPGETHKDEAVKTLAWLNGPSCGMRIRYGSHRLATETNEHGGHMTFYRFTITGQEAISFRGIERIIISLVQGGAKIDQARVRDIEEDTAWEDVMAVAPADPSRGWHGGGR